MLPLCSELRHELLARARRAISEAASGEPAARSESRHNDDFRRDREENARGVFVTLHRRGQLRGCVGQIEACGPLGEVVERCAIAAAEEDPRFAPVKPAEVAELEIEISLLSPLEPVAPAAIEVGRHGLVVERGMQRGLLLPQVATERHWQWQRFLEETCVKAGLERDAWKNPGTRTFAFTTEVFSEADDA
jgi:AmmeMemoRadiSam system protein A